MDHWMELRTALMVARLGTVSAAAEALGVHRATINRHVETLETVLGAPLFHRHARGYTLTDAGEDMLDVTNRAEEMFSDLEGRSRGRAGQLSGDLRVTALIGMVSLVMPAIKAFHLAHPETPVEFVAGSKLARLEHGEAHVAFRAGTKPQEPDYVVLPFRQFRFGLFASRDYVNRKGMPENGDFSGHSFVGTVGEPSPIPYTTWMDRNVRPEDLSFRTSDQQVMFAAVRQGFGLGFLADHDTVGDPDLVEIIPPDDAWLANIWIVTHVDLHRTAKVQEFLRFVRQEAQQG
ncbi:MAG: LysR family transcriptional regulator [Roseibium sp.]|nr:LysR family transcriptional regulator [Roseibium sp.]